MYKYGVKLRRVENERERGMDGWIYRVYHAKLEVRNQWHSAFKSAKVIMKKDSKNTCAPVFCAEIS